LRIVGVRPYLTGRVPHDTIEVRRQRRRMATTITIVCPECEKSMKVP
jgi:hypothetical protein